MANWHTLQNNFSLGEVSPRFNAATPSEVSQSGLSELTNGLVTMQGSAIKRLGTRFLRDLELPETANVRLSQFFDYLNQRQILIFIAGKVRLFPTVLIDYADTPDVAIADGYVQHVINPTFTNGFTAWSILGSVYEETEFGGGHEFAKMDYWQSTSNRTVQTRLRYNGYPLPENIRRNYVRQSFTVTDANFFIIRGKARLSKRDTEPFFSIRVGTTLGGQELALLQEPMDTSNKVYEIRSQVALPEAFTGEVFVEASLEFITPVVGRRYWRDNILRFDEIYIYTGEAEPPAELEIDTPYNDEDLENLHFIQSPFENKDFLVLCPGHDVHTLYFDADSGAFVFEPFEFETPAPTLWALGQPTIGCAYQGRLILSGAVARPETVWGSRVGEWDDFNVPGQIDPADPLEMTPTDRGFARWLTGFQRLLMGTNEAEYSIFSQSGIIQPSDIGVFQQSAYGSTRNPQKFVIGHSVPIPTSGNTALRLLYFSDEGGGYLAEDVLQKAEHLGKRIIRRYFHVREPHDQLWCIMVDGSVCVMSFDEGYEMSAWSQFRTEGRFIDGETVIDEFGRTVVVLTVERVINGVAKKYLELVSDLRNPAEWQYLDSRKTTFNTNDETTIGGFEHLAYKPAHLFVDDEYTGIAEVNPAGEIEVPEGTFKIDVGLGYSFSATTLPQGSLAPEAVGLNAKKRYSKVGIRGVMSRPPVINGQRPPDRSAPAEMDRMEPVVQQLDVDVVDMDWTDSAPITIQEPLPVGITLTGIYGKLTSNEL